jgi:hypothetical protein
MPHGFFCSQHDCTYSFKKTEQRSLFDPAKIFLTSKFSYLLFPNPTDKTKIGTAIGERLLIATDKPSNQVLGFDVTFPRLSHPLPKCRAKSFY